MSSLRGPFQDSFSSVNDESQGIDSTISKGIGGAISLEHVSETPEFTLDYAKRLALIPKLERIKLYKGNFKSKT